MPVNLVHLLGEVSDSPRRRAFGEGREALELRILTHEERPGAPPRPEWSRVVAYDALAAALHDLQKGEIVFVEGRLHTRLFDKDGRSERITEVVAQQLQRVGGRGAAPRRSEQAPRPRLSEAEQAALNRALLEVAGLSVSPRQGPRPEVAARIRALAEEGAEPEAPFGGLRIRPLHVAARAADLDAVRALLGLGARANVTDADGDTPLHALFSVRGAPESRALQVADELLKHRASADCANHNQETPLHAAAEAGNAPAVALLIERGAPVNGLDLQGQSPLTRAALAGHTGVIAVLLQHGARATRELIAAVKEKRLPAVAQALERALHGAPHVLTPDKPEKREKKPKEKTPAKVAPKATAAPPPRRPAPRNDDEDEPDEDDTDDEDDEDEPSTSATPAPTARVRPTPGRPAPGRPAPRAPADAPAEVIPPATQAQLRPLQEALRTAFKTMPPLAAPATAQDILATLEEAMKRLALQAATQGLTSGQFGKHILRTSPDPMGEADLEDLDEETLDPYAEEFAELLWEHGASRIASELLQLVPASQRTTLSPGRAPLQVLCGVFCRDAYHVLLEEFSRHYPR